jgi:hypothetical protein
VRDLRFEQGELTAELRQQTIRSPIGLLMCSENPLNETRRSYFFVLGFLALSFLGFLVVSGFCCIAITSSGMVPALLLCAL